MGRNALPHCPTATGVYDPLRNHELIVAKETDVQPLAAGRRIYTCTLIDEWQT